MILVLIWIQWCWKWTQARALQDKCDFKIHESGLPLRQMAKEKTPFWRHLKKIIESWKQVEPSLIENILEEIMDNYDWENLILDWFVRNMENKILVERVLWKLDYKVVFFDLHKEEAMNRLIWRMYNPNTGETFPKWIFKDPKTWEKLINRADDQEKAILERINLFFEKTLPLLDEYRDEWILVEVNANQPVADVTKELLEKLWL
jgi:adenylate kinase